METTDIAENMKARDHTRDNGSFAGGAQNCHARVYAKDGERCGVAGPLGGYWVAIAASCLLQPEVGDKVLVSMGAGEGYILAVLEQADTSQADLRMPGHARLSAPQGSLTVAARDGLKLAGGPAVALEAQSTSLVTGSLAVHARSMQLAGDSHHSVWRERHEVAHIRSTVAVRMEYRAQDRRTRISGHDDVAAGSQRIVVQGDWRVRARSADVRARKRASIDAEHVQIG